jgi:hypothetical protein
VQSGSLRIIDKNYPENNREIVPSSLETATAVQDMYRSGQRGGWQRADIDTIGGLSSRSLIICGEALLESLDLLVQFGDFLPHIVEFICCEVFSFFPLCYFVHCQC